MPNHHPHTPAVAPSAAQQRYLRRLAEQTGTSFTPPRSKSEASREITRLERLQREPRADLIREQRAVHADLQAGAGDSVRHRASETSGYGASARWAHGGRDTGR